MAGSGFENNLLYANNADFSNSTQPSNANGITADNQVWLGRSAVSGTLSQIDVMTLTAGTGITLTRLGAGVPGTPGTLTIANTGATTDLHTARYIVSAGGAADGANYTTIATAYAAAVAAGGNQTVFIQPGTYTENLTLTAGINLSAYSCDSQSPTPNVIIFGKLTATFAGAVAISGIQLKTNADFALSVTGAAATIVRLANCFIYGFNNNAIQFTSSSASSKIEFFWSKGDIENTFAYFTHSGAGKLAFNHGLFENNSASTTASTISGSGTLSIFESYYANAFTSSGTSNIELGHSEIFGAIIAGGTGASQSILQCYLDGGTASALSVGAGVTVPIENCTINSTNATAAITGVGTVKYGGLVFKNSATNINTTTQTILNEGPSRTIGTSNSGNTNTLTCTNSSNTATSNAAIVATVGGATSADAYYQAVVAGTTTWTWGVDNSDTDAFALSANAALGTTNVMHVTTAGEINYPLQPAFSAFNSGTDSDVTGDATIATVDFDTEIFDQNGDFAADTFTAPVTGNYQLSSVIRLEGVLSTHTVGLFKISTSNRSYPIQFAPSKIFDVNTQVSVGHSHLCDMDAADTATITIQVSNGTKVIDITGAAGSPMFTIFEGFLSC